MSATLVQRIARRAQARRDTAARQAKRAAKARAKARKAMHEEWLRQQPTYGMTDGQKDRYFITQDWKAEQEWKRRGGA
jgi:hypothetical protein